MPTSLPPPRRGEARATGRLVFNVLFNGAMLVSALLLAFAVLVREQQYALGQQQIANQTIQPPLTRPSEERFIPPLD
ncbi:MAG TPA: hypothetical protein VMG39_03920 [Pseudolabrys sp.]|nr:hypothetical protein [Pseudolabrys sp.]